jgi:glycosyltransferase involved in cell wall biosynthesis
VVRLQLRWLRLITRPDITHVQWIDDRAWLLAKIGISPLVLTAWGTDLNMTRDSNYDPVQLRRKAETISKAALLIADSQDMIDIAHNLANLSVPSILLPIGIDTKLFRPGLRADALNLRRKLNIPDAAKVVLSPRAFRQNYGHEVITKAFARAVSNSNIDAYLVFKAYDCWDRSYVNNITTIASACGIADRIRIIDEMAYDQLPIYYAMGDFAVNHPIMDAFPVTFLECLACELPVLTRHLPAYDSLGVSTYLRFTDAPTEESLVKGITAMFFSAQSCPQEMSRARAYVSLNFDESVVARSLALAYDRILEVDADANSPRAQIREL